MKVSESAQLTGPNVYASQPVLRCTLAGADDPVDPARLFAVLPELRARLEACPGTGRRRDARAQIEHLFEHVCIELLERAGCEARCVRAEAGSRMRRRDALIAGEETALALDAAHLAAETFEHLQAEAGAEQPEGEPPFDLALREEQLRRSAQRMVLPVQDRAIVDTARRLDVPVFRLAGRILQLGHGRLQQRVNATRTTHTNVVGNDIASNKDFSRRILREVGLPVPSFERVYRARDAADAAQRIGYPVVVKPNNGNMGEGVSVGVGNRREVLAAYRRAREHDRSVLVEQLVEGNDYRLLVVDGSLCAAARRVPGHVVGDGIHTIAQLVESLNSDPRRGSGSRQSWTRIEIDDQAERLLVEAGYDLQSIPQGGEAVFLRRNANTSDGGTAVDVTDSVHPDNTEIALRAAKAIGLDIAGVDLLAPDISKSLWTDGGAICEVNSKPGIRKHMWPAKGRARDVTTPVVRMLFPAGAPSRIPVAVITGDGDTGAAARILAHLLATTGRRVGLYADGRVHLGTARAGDRELPAHEATRAILLDPEVDAAVLELQPREVLSHGLPYDASDVCLVLGRSAGAGTPRRPAQATRDATTLMARAARRGVLLAEEGGSLDLEALESPPTRLLTPPIDAGSEPSVDLAGPRLELDGLSLSEYSNDERQTAIDVRTLLERAVAPDDVDARHAALLACAAALRLGETAEAIQRGFASLERRSSPAPEADRA